MSAHAWRQLHPQLPVTAQVSCTPKFPRNQCRQGKVPAEEKCACPRLGSQNSIEDGRPAAGKKKLAEPEVPGNLASATCTGDAGLTALSPFKSAIVWTAKSDEV